MRFLTDVQLQTQPFLKSLNHGDVASHSARKSDLLFNTHPAEQSCGTSRDRLMNAPQNILDFLSLPQPGKHFRFSENSTGCADSYWFLILQSPGSKFVEGDVEGGCGGAEKAPGSRRAFVIHAEIHDLAFGIDPDGLGVLAAHVQDGARAGEHMHRAAPVTADLRHLRVAEGHPVATVASADDVLDFIFLPPGVLERLLIGMFRRPDHICAGVDQRPADDPSVLVDDNCFGLRRSDIDACRIGHG